MHIGLEWNQGQLKIAQHLQQQLTPKGVSQQYGFSLRTCYKVQHALKHGDNPGQVTQEMIDKAPVPKIFPQKAESPSGDGAQAPAKEGVKTPASPGVKTPASPGVKTFAVSETSALQFVAQLQPIPLTVDIHISYLCAVKNGYEGTLGDWLSLVSRDFWLGRKRNFYAEMAGFEPLKEEVASGTPTG